MARPRGRRGGRRSGGGTQFLTPGSGPIVLEPSAVTPPAPPVLTVERAGNVIASPPDVPAAIATAKSASADGTEVLVKVRGNAIVAYKGSKLAYHTLA